jgi:hypothetical protein
MDWSSAGSGAPRGTERGPHICPGHGGNEFPVEFERYVIKNKYSVNAYY